MKMCGVAVATMWSYSMEGNPVFMSMNPFSLISTGFVVVVVIYRLFCFILFRFCVFFLFPCFPFNFVLQRDEDNHNLSFY